MFSWFWNLIFIIKWLNDITKIKLFKNKSLEKITKLLSSTTLLLIENKSDLNEKKYKK